MLKFAFLLVFSPALGAKDAGPCPADWVDATLTGMGCLFFNSSQRMTWHDASVSCYHADSFLVEIETELQFDFLRSELSFLANSGIPGSWWTSASDMGREGLWYWASSLSPVPDFVWHSGYNQPDGGPDQNCGIMSVSNNFLFFDHECDVDNYGNFESFYAICQIK